MRGTGLKLISIIFIIFLIVGNLTAPPELKKDIAQPEGVMKVLYNAGKFFVLPFKNVKYRIDNAFNDNDDTISEVNYMETYEPPTPPGYVEDYFTFQDRTYSYLKPLNTSIIPIKTGFTLKKTTPKSIYWSFTIEEFIKDMNSEPVLNTVRLFLDGLYGMYDEKDKQTFQTVWCNKWYTKEWCEKINPVGIGRHIHPLHDLGVPPTPENIRAHYMNYYANILGFDKESENPVLPSKLILGKIMVDCDGLALLKFVFLYHLNKAMGFNAEYYEIILHAKGKDVPHAELFVYYPETGKWEVYTGSFLAGYYYKYPLDRVNLDAYKEYVYTGRLFLIDIYNRTINPNCFILPITILDVDDEELRGLYVIGGKFQFNSFEEALYWYLYWQMTVGSSVYPLNGDENTPVRVGLYKYPTPEDPHVYYVKEWIGREVTLNQLKEVLVERGELREIDLVVERSDVPPALANPKPIPLEWYPPKAVAGYYERLAEYKKMKENSGGIIDMIVNGVKRLGEVLFG